MSEIVLIEKECFRPIFSRVFPFQVKIEGNGICDKEFASNQTKDNLILYIKCHRTSTTSKIAPGSRKSTWPKSVALLNQALPLMASQNRILLNPSGAQGGTRPPVLEMPEKMQIMPKFSWFNGIFDLCTRGTCSFYSGELFFGKFGSKKWRSGKRPWKNSREKLSKADKDEFFNLFFRINFGLNHLINFILTLIDIDSIIMELSPFGTRVSIKKQWATFIP